MSSSFSFSDDSGTLLSTDPGVIGDQGSSGFAYGPLPDPIVFDVTLVPNDTYEISMSSSTNAPDTGTADGTSPIATVRFSAMATFLPEPESIAVVTCLACTTLARRRRN